LKQPAKITADQSGRLTFLQVAQTISVNHGALAYLLGINALRASDGNPLKP
jgi:integrase/recombinase XerD